MIYLDHFLEFFNIWHVFLFKILKDKHFNKSFKTLVFSPYYPKKLILTVF